LATHSSSAFSASQKKHQQTHPSQKPPKPSTKLKNNTKISHGVIEATGRMAYAYSFGGLNEATADILSVCVQDHAHTTGAARRPLSWFPGEQMFSASCERPWIRSMPNPADDGRSWSCW
jgi:hypothetical protein